MSTLQKIGLFVGLPLSFIGTAVGSVLAVDSYRDSRTGWNIQNCLAWHSGGTANALTGDNDPENKPIKAVKLGCGNGMNFTITPDEPTAARLEREAQRKRDSR
jgi:hypothetical protein